MTKFVRSFYIFIEMINCRWSHKYQSFRWTNKQMCTYLWGRQCMDGILY